MNNGIDIYFMWKINPFKSFNVNQTYIGEFMSVIPVSDSDNKFSIRREAADLLVKKTTYGFSITKVPETVIEISIAGNHVGPIGTYKYFIDLISVLKRFLHSSCRSFPDLYGLIISCGNDQTIIGTEYDLIDIFFMRYFGFLLLLFPVAWLLLAASRYGWWRAVASYLVPGTVFTALLTAIGVFGIPGVSRSMQSWLLLVLTWEALWPVYLLGVLGVYGLFLFG